jgi:hypothetical protein
MTPFIPVRVDGRFRLKETLGSGSYGMLFVSQLVAVDSHDLKPESSKSLLATVTKVQAYSDI